MQPKSPEKKFIAAIAGSKKTPTFATAIERDSNESRTHRRIRNKALKLNKFRSFFFIQISPGNSRQPPHGLP